MSTTAAPAAPIDPLQKKKLIQGVSVWVIGVLISLALIPVVNASSLADGLKATLNTVLLLGVPKIFLLVAVAIMGKPGFAYLKSLISSHFRKYAPPATVSRERYRIGLILLITMLLLNAAGPYVAHEVLPFRQDHPRLVAIAGDLLILATFFVLGGDFWDKLRALFNYEARAVFPKE